MYLAIGGALFVVLSYLPRLIRNWTRPAAMAHPDEYQTPRVPSPAPHYNFARLPVVRARDAFWEAKQAKKSLYSGAYEAFELPKNTGLGVYVGGAACVFGFAVIWHLWWLALLAAAGLVYALVRRTFEEEVEYEVSATEAKRLDVSVGKAMV